MRSLINIYKYESVRAASVVLAELMNERLRDQDGIVVPLPTINRHIRERGYDHIGLLARKLNLPCRKLLKRVNSSVQVGASAEKRREQAAMAYAVAKDFDRNQKYILLDDVWTTGSSMLAARDVLRGAGAKNISVAIIAKTTN